jgi:hypothetical protein
MLDNSGIDLWVKDSLPRAGDDRPTNDEPEIPQEEAHSDEYEANQWVRCGRYRSRFAVEDADGNVIGSVGVSGGSAEEDMEVAQAGVEAFENL